MSKHTFPHPPTPIHTHRLTPTHAHPLTPTQEAAAKLDAEKAKLEDEEEGDQEGEDEDGGPGGGGGGGGADDHADIPIDKVVWMTESAETGWTIHRPETSRQMEEALRAGRESVSMHIDGNLYTVKLTKSADGKGPEQSNEEGNAQRLRRHIVGEGLQGEWEMLSLKFNPPMSLTGDAALKLLEKVWSQGETFNGAKHSLGFLFLYSLLQGNTPNPNPNPNPNPLLAPPRQHPRHPPTHPPTHPPIRHKPHSTFHI